MFRKFLAIAWIAALVLVVGAAGFGAWRFQQSRQKEQAKNNEQSSENQTIQLQSVQPGGLSVNTDPKAAALGQVGGAQDNSKSEPKSSPPKIDPAQFGEYEKYKNEGSVLFGEVQIGNGAGVAVNKKVGIYYKGWLTNGQLFDQSSADKDGKLQPLVFTLGVHEVIAGMEQGIVGMKVGGSRLLVVPPAVGYGKEGHPPVPANAVMVFLVQLVAVEE